MLGGHRSVPGFGQLLREMPAVPGASAEKAA
jgi:hypothetical protein